jgi:hypothetical protein
MPLRVIWRTTERKSDREQLYTDTRPRCDFTLPGKYLQQARLGPMNATDDADTHSEGCSQSVLGYDHTPLHGALPPHWSRDFHRLSSGNHDTSYRTYKAFTITIWTHDLA